MRTLVGIFLSIGFAASAGAYECERNEAQFMGKVSAVRSDWYDQGVADCYLKFEYVDYKPSKVCPLEYINAVNVEIYAGNTYCEGIYKVGDGISGYLVQGKDGRIYFDL